MQIKIFRRRFRKEKGVDLGSRKNPVSNNRACLHHLNTLHRSAKDKRLIRKLQGINGCIDLEISLTILCDAVGTTSMGLLNMIIAELDEFISSGKIYISTRINLDDMRSVAKAITTFGLDLGLFSKGPMLKPSLEKRAVLSYAMNSFGIACSTNVFKNQVEDIGYTGFFTSENFIGLNLVRYSGVPHVGISYAHSSGNHPNEVSL